MSLCEKNCNFNGYNSTNKRVDCECQIKESLFPFYNMTIDSDSLINKFKIIKNLINIEVFKCYKLLFSIKGLIRNIGSYLLFMIILVNSILIFAFYYKDYNNFKKKIGRLPKKIFNQKRKGKKIISNKTEIKGKVNKSKYINNNLNAILLNNLSKIKLYKSEELNKSTKNMVTYLRTKNEFKVENVNIKKQKLN